MRIEATLRSPLAHAFILVTWLWMALPCALASAPAGDASDDDARVRVWLTTSDQAKALSAQADVAFSERKPLRADITVDPRQRFQRMVGFGASITDASAWLIQQRMDPGQRDALLRELFGREDDGIGLDFVRLTIGASDFSRSHYSLDDPPDGAPDPELAHFDIAPNRTDVIPVTRAALAINPRLTVMASPWSAPAWMKDSGSLIRGRLLPQYYDAFARYLLAYVDAYRAEGIPIHALTVQNEPDFEPDSYPGMRFNAPERARFIGRHLGPLLAAHASPPQLFDWDHNWDKPEEPLQVLADAQANRYVDAVAWHCYAGDPSAQTPVHDAFPGKDAYMTECSGGDWEPLRSGGLTLQARRLIVGATRHWARGVLFWNLALDERGGPHAGGCDTCRGVVTIDSASGDVARTDDYYALAHASRFVHPGAWRIASTESGRGLDNVAFLNEDDGSVALVVVNSARTSRRFGVSQGNRAFEYRLPAKSLATFVWKATPD
ncbi:MAG: glycoside hydrolase family 30 beta sandwich domain-containing protein [Pseudoxanthomonas sp.]